MDGRMTDDDLIRLHRQKQKRLLNVLGSDEGMNVLDDLERHFEVHLPVFQGKAGSFDPLDAMRRDAYREVFLYCRHHIDKARAEFSKDNNQ